MSHRTWSQSYRRLLNREPPGPPPKPVRTLVTQGIIIVRTIAPDITPDIAETMPRALPVRDGLFGELGLPSAKESPVKHKLECARQSAGDALQRRSFIARRLHITGERPTPRPQRRMFRPRHVPASPHGHGRHQTTCLHYMRYHCWVPAALQCNK